METVSIVLAIMFFGFCTYQVIQHLMHEAFRAGEYHMIETVNKQLKEQGVAIEVKLNQLD